MRRLLSTARSSLTNRGSAIVHIAGFSAVAMLAAAAGPAPTALKSDDYSTPVAAPIKAVARPAGPVMRQMMFEAPLKGFGVNSAFGLRKLAHESRARAHKGVDIAAPQGTAVYAAAEGDVVRAGYDAGGYGNFIEIAHPNGMTTLYAHLSRVDVASGMTIESGKRIGLVGSTGYSTGPHLHFEVSRNGSQIDPEKVIGRVFHVAVKTDLIDLG